MEIRRISKDDQLPVSLDDLRLDLRIDDGDDDATLERMERTAAGLIERRSGYVVIPGTFEALFNPCDQLVIRRAPLRQVTAIAAMTERNTWTDLDLDDFRVLVRERDFQLTAYPGFTPPTFFVPDNSLRVQFSAGFALDLNSGESDGESGDDLVPFDDVVRGVLIALTAHYYENRELFMADKMAEIESSAGGLLNAIRTFW